MKNILVFGDSNSWGYDSRTYDPALGSGRRMAFDERWPGRLQALLGGDFRVIENALNARTCMLDDPYFPNRMGMRSLQVALDANAPLDLVILQLGVNDLKHMFCLTAGMIAYSVEQLVAEAKKRHYGYPAPKVLVIAPHPTHPRIGEMIFGFSFGPDAYEKSLGFSKWYSEMAARQNVDFLDLAPLHFELNELDGLHYAKADHKKLAEAAHLKVREIFGELSDHQWSDHQ